MSSAPSASALSAVLRCRGTIWSRNPPSQQPRSAARSRAPPGRRSAPAWEASGLRERVLLGKIITVVFGSLQVAFRAPRSKRWRAEARHAAPAAPKARHLARTLQRAAWALVVKLSARSPAFSLLPAGLLQRLRSTGWSSSRLLSGCVNVSFSAGLRSSSIRNPDAPPHRHSQRAEKLQTGGLKVSFRGFHTAHNSRAVQFSSAFFF